MREKRTTAYYNLFLSNLQHNLLKFKSLKFKRLKIAEGNYKGFPRVWVPRGRCPSSAADLHFSNTLKVKRHVNALYISKRINVDHRALLRLAASPDQTPQSNVPEIVALSGPVWTSMQGQSCIFRYQLKNPGPSVHKPTGLRIVDLKSGLAQSLMSCVTLNKSFTSLGLSFPHAHKPSIYFGRCL